MNVSDRNKTIEERQLTPYLSPAGAWALAVGTSIGWGSLVVTANTYLKQAGPAGSVLGLLAGMFVMLVITRNYFYMMSCYPDAGGAYTFAKEMFGYDHGFLVAWFLCLTYLAMLWANATSLPLFGRYFLGNIFHFGYLYSLFGYEVYAGEVLLTAAAVLLIAALCASHRKITAGALTGMAALFSCGIVFCFAAAIIRHGGSGFRFRPGFIPDKDALSQIVKIACISPWAFIGFENISHAAEEFAFPRKNVHRILVASVLSATLLYVCVLVLSVTAYPPEYDSWLAYISDLGNLPGIEGLPAFYAARHYAGDAGVFLLILSLLALILSSLIGNILALSRLFCAVARDRVISERFARLNRHHVPADAIVLILLLSIPIPFLGRTAIGWIVDVTTLGATLIYGFVSACALKMARQCGDRTERITGVAGLLIMIGFGLYLLVPSLFSTGSMETESYILFTVWAVLGFLFFRNILARDRERRFGKSIIVWIALLSMILFTSLVWMSQTTMNGTGRTIAAVRDYYDDLDNMSVTDHTDEEAFIEEAMRSQQNANLRSIGIVIGLFAISLGAMMNNYTLMNKRMLESEAELGNVRNIANTDPLTGVKSKHAFADREQTMDAEIAEGRAEPFALAVCDVNGLKQVNDTLGHKAGDEYIRSASRMICELFQHSPVFRIGGDEFAVILKGRDYAVRQELLQRLHDTSVENIGKGEVVVSGGMADYVPGEDISAHTVFERADAKMYLEKKALKSLGAPTR